MTSLDQEIRELSELAGQIRARLGLRTYVVGVKLLEDPSGLPPGARRPLRDFGSRLPACRALNVARTYGWQVGLTAEDMFCVIGAAAFGMVEEPGYVFESGLVSHHARDDEVARSLWLALRKRFLEPGSCSAVLFSPMHKLTSRPDVVVAYGTPTQVAVLLKALAWAGELASMEFVGIASCSTIPYVLKEGRTMLALPCAGERLLGLTEEDEAWIAFRPELLPSMAEGIKGIRRIFPYPPVKPLEEPRALAWYPMDMEDYRRWLEEKRRA